jgi:outer membrane protein TolC
VAIPGAVAAATSEAPFRVNPATLRVQITQENVSVLTGLNRVYQAKEQVNIARAGIFPSLNLGMLLTGLTAAPTFALSSISVLVPVLIPSNWYNVEVAESSMVANGYAFHALELNKFASAYALYNTILGDMAVRANLEEQLERYEQIRERAEARFQSGKGSEVDLMKAHAKVALARHQLSQFRQVVAQSKATFRQMLGLPLSREIVFENLSPVPHVVETASIAKALNRVFERAPEALQIQALLKASNAAAWNAT